MNMKVQELLSMDYLNIQDVPVLKEIIEASNLHLDAIIKQIHELSNIRDRNLAEGRTVVQKMTNMEEKNLTKTAHYRKITDAAVRDYDVNRTQLTEEHNKTISSTRTITSDLESKHWQLTTELDQKIKALKEKEASLRSNEIEELDFQAEIKQKSCSLISRQYDHHDNMNRQEELEAEQNREIFEKNKKLIKELKRDVKMEAGRIVYQEKYENEDKNYELKVKLLEIQDQVTKLRKERNEIVKARNQCRINASLNSEEVEEYKAVGSIQKSKIKMYTDKVENLKKTITSDISKLENKIKEKKSKWENQLKGHKLKLFNLEKQKEELKINIEKYKMLGETILMQREEVQEFFLMAIESCKREMGDTTGLESNDKQYGEKVDIEELLPKDKHRIITNLYTKLALAPSK